MRMSKSSKKTGLSSAVHIWVVDRIEEGSAAVEVDGAAVMTVPVWMLPEAVCEGDVLRVEHDRRRDRSVMMIVPDNEERGRRLTRSAKQTAVRSKNDRPGDITL